jgi:hypothetical protein
MDRSPQFHILVTFVGNLNDPHEEVCMIDFAGNILRLANRGKFGNEDNKTFNPKFIPTRSSKDTESVYVVHMACKSVLNHNNTPLSIEHPQNMLHHILFDRDKSNLNLNFFFRGIDHTIRLSEITSGYEKYHEMVFTPEKHAGQIQSLRKTIVFNSNGFPGHMVFLNLDKETVCMIAIGKGDTFVFYKPIEEIDHPKLGNMVRGIQDWAFVCIPEKSLFSMTNDNASYTFHIDA